MTTDKMFCVQGYSEEQHRDTFEIISAKAKRLAAKSPGSEIAIYKLHAIAATPSNVEIKVLDATT